MFARANQLRLSVTHVPLVAQGVAANMQGLDQSISRDSGTLDYCRLSDITVQAWSPFQAGFFNGVFLGSPDYPGLNAVIDRRCTRCRPAPRARRRVRRRRRGAP
jgi:predicted oxidoreductase